MNFKKFFLSLAVTLLCGAVAAQTKPAYIDIDLWPGGLPNSNGTEHLPPSDATNIYKPTIRVFLPPKENATGRAVVACPGGGYKGLAYNHEGYDWAPFFTERGIALIVLKYRMPKEGHYEVPGSDAREAIREVKRHAAEWGIDLEQIGIMGSSAGGHLASTISTHIEADTRPAFQILFYPVITMNETFTHKGSLGNLLGKTPDPKLVEYFSNEKQVTTDTPRAFITFSDDDGGVSPVNGVQYYLALHASKVPASIYIYPTGGHGWGYKDTFRYRDQMLSDLDAWLKSF